MDGVLHLDAFFLQQLAHLTQHMLGLGHGHAVTRDDDHLLGILHQEGGVIGRALFPGLVAIVGAASRGRRLTAKAAQDHREEGAVHALAHDVGQDRAR